MEARHVIASHLGDLGHLLQLVRVAGDEVEEGQAFKVLRSLVGQLDNLSESSLSKRGHAEARRTHLMIALLQRLLPDSHPAFRTIDRLRRLDRNLQVATLDRQVEPRRLLLDKMQGDLRVAFLLQIGDDALADQVGRSDDVQDFFVVLTDESELEAVFSRVDRDRLRSCVAVEAVNGLAFDAGEVNRLFERLDDAVVAVRIISSFIDFGDLGEQTHPCGSAYLI